MRWWRIIKWRLFHRKGARGAEVEDMRTIETYDCQLAKMLEGKDLFFLVEKQGISPCCFQSAGIMTIGEIQQCTGCKNMLRRVTREQFLERGYALLRERILAL